MRASFDGGFGSYDMRRLIYVQWVSVENRLESGFLGGGP